MNPTHEKIHPLINFCVRRFWELYGGDRAEIYQNAWLIFLEYEKTHDPARGSLEKRAEYLIFARLRDLRRGEMRRARRDRAYIPAARRFNAESFRRELSADAAAVADLIFERGRPIPGAAPPITKFWNVLRDRGLPITKIFAAFREIEAALV